MEASPLDWEKTAATAHELLCISIEIRRQVPDGPWKGEDPALHTLLKSIVLPILEHGTSLHAAILSVAEAGRSSINKPVKTVAVLLRPLYELHADVWWISGFSRNAPGPGSLQAMRNRLAAYLQASLDESADKIEQLKKLIPQAASDPEKTKGLTSEIAMRDRHMASIRTEMTSAGLTPEATAINKYKNIFQRWDEIGWSSRYRTDYSILSDFEHMGLFGLLMDDAHWEVAGLVHRSSDIVCFLLPPCAFFLPEDLRRGALNRLKTIRDEITRREQSYKASFGGWGDSSTSSE